MVTYFMNEEPFDRETAYIGVDTPFEQPEDRPWGPLATLGWFALGLILGFVTGRVFFSIFKSTFEQGSEVARFKFQAAELLKEPDKCTPMDLLQFLHSYSSTEVYPNIEISLRLFLTLPVTVASCERSFSKLKLVKHYLRSSMGQERLSGLSIMSIESGIAGSLHYDDVIDEFAAVKARKMHYCIV